MQIDKTSSTAFGAVNSKAAENVLFSRLSNYKRYPKYRDFVTSQDKKDFDIVLTKNGKHSLEATVYNKEGLFLFSKKENVLNGIFNISPLRFLKRISNAAENFYCSIQKAEM